MTWLWLTWEPNSNFQVEYFDSSYALTRNYDFLTIWTHFSKIKFRVFVFHLNLAARFSTWTYFCFVKNWFFILIKQSIFFLYWGMMKIRVALFDQVVMRVVQRCQMKIIVNLLFCCYKNCETNQLALILKNKFVFYPNYTKTILCIFYSK